MPRRRHVGAGVGERGKTGRTGCKIHKRVNRAPGAGGREKRTLDLLVRCLLILLALALLPKAKPVVLVVLDLSLRHLGRLGVRLLRLGRRLLRLVRRSLVLVALALARAVVLRLVLIISRPALPLVRVVVDALKVELAVLELREHLLLNLAVGHLVVVVAALLVVLVVKERLRLGRSLGGCALGCAARNDLVDGHSGLCRDRGMVSMGCDMGSDELGRVAHHCVGSLLDVGLARVLQCERGA